MQGDAQHEQRREQRAERWILVLGLLLAAAGTLLFLAASGVHTIAGSSEGARQLLAERPLSALVAITPPGDGPLAERPTLPDLVRAAVARYGRGEREGFPIPGDAGDALRTADGWNTQVVVRWLDPLTRETGMRGFRFGANPDFLAFFGDRAPGNLELSPWWRGSSTEGWLWSNHEYLAAGAGNRLPRVGRGPEGQPLTLALWMKTLALIRDDPTNDAWSREEVDAFIFWHKAQLGGSWMRVRCDEATGVWRLDRDAKNLRFDATSSSRFALQGAEPAHLPNDDFDEPMERVAGRAVIPGTLANCAGGVTPWGTLISGEENAQDAYGELEACWPPEGGRPRFEGDGMGFRPGGDVHLPIAADPSSPLGRISDDNAPLRRDRDLYGWLVEIDPGRLPGEIYDQLEPGRGHRKLGNVGRARWEGVSFVLGPDWRLVPGRPIVMYAANDRRGGRVWKFVSREPYEAGMGVEAARRLLEQGTLYVAHVEELDNRTGLHHRAPDVPNEVLLRDGRLDAARVEGHLQRPTAAHPLRGRWIEISLTSTDLAPNGPALGAPRRTVGEALADRFWNGLAGFPDANTLRKCLYTACAKVGVRELNRPEDVAYSPVDRRLYVALTGNTARPALLPDGRLVPDGVDLLPRDDREGAIWAIVEEDPERPGASRNFEVVEVWRGWGLDQVDGDGAAFVPTADPRVILDARFATSRPDNLALDEHGGLYFTTDGRFARSGGRMADALYYLDLAPESPTRGLAFRLVAMPADAEPTGPCFTPDQRTLFLNVQHPGEGAQSAWPPR